MPKITPFEADSFSGILDHVERYQNSRDASWYRGTGNQAHSLVPSLARRIPPLSPTDMGNQERAIANSFAQRSPPFVETNLSDEWKALFFMQHYGIPTRLLDWTESPFVALYFALTSVSRDKTGKAAADVALWLCDPILWNRCALSHISFAGGILDDSSEEIKSYSPSSDIDQRANVPIMIYGTHNSPRIVAQRGVFSLFGKGTEGMEKTYSASNFTAGALEKVIIRKANVDQILKSLYRKGFAESTIYPDLHGLSLEIKRSFGYI